MNLLSNFHFTKKFSPKFFYVHHYTFIILKALITISFALFASPIEEFTQKIVIEDFETSEWSQNNIKIYSNSEFQPEVKVSKSLVSPNILSNSSLLIRFPKNTTEQNIEIRFQTPKEIEKYIVAIRFQVFANNQGGELAFLIEDTNFELKKFPVCVLNFSGWKEFDVKLARKIYQQDRVLHQHAKIRFIGFLYTPVLNKSFNREDILGLDDIEIFVLDKYKTPQYLFHRK